MSNTTTIRNNTLTITGLDASWSLENDLPTEEYLMIKAIMFVPSASGDTIAVYDTTGNYTTAGATIFYANCADVTDIRIEYFNPPLRCRPAISSNTLTLSTAADCKLTYILA